MNWTIISTLTHNIRCPILFAFCFLWWRRQKRKKSWRRWDFEIVTGDSEPWMKWTQRIWSIARIRRWKFTEIFLLHNKKLNKRVRSWRYYIHKKCAVLIIFFFVYFLFCFKCNHMDFLCGMFDGNWAWLRRSQHTGKRKGWNFPCEENFRHFLSTLIFLYFQCFPLLSAALSARPHVMREGRENVDGRVGGEIERKEIFFVAVELLNVMHIASQQTAYCRQVSLSAIGFCILPAHTISIVLFLRLQFLCYGRCSFRWDCIKCMFLNILCEFFIFWEFIDTARTSSTVTKGMNLCKLAYLKAISYYILDEFFRFICS